MCPNHQPTVGNTPSTGNPKSHPDAVPRGIQHDFFRHAGQHSMPNNVTIGNRISLANMWQFNQANSSGCFERGKRCNLGAARRGSNIHVVFFSLFQKLSLPLESFLALIASYIYHAFASRHTFVNYGLRLVDAKAQRGRAEALPPSQFEDKIANASKLSEFVKQKLVPNMNSATCHVVTLM